MRNPFFICVIPSQSQEEILNMFFLFLDRDEYNQKLHGCLTSLFLDATYSGKPELLSPSVLSPKISLYQIEAIHDEMEGINDYVEEDYNRAKTEDKLLAILGQFDPNRILDLMRRMFSFIKKHKF